MRAILFAPGAGAPSTSEWMSGWATRLSQLGAVTRFDYAYRLAGRRAPDRPEKLIAAHRAALAALTGLPRVLVGKSMGSRIGCHVSLVDPVAALVCFGYPLVGVGKKRPVRDAVLRELRTPILFVAGTRDPLCPLDALAKVRAEMVAPNELYVVEGGDHSLEVPKRAGPQAEVDDRIAAVVGQFLDRHAPIG